MVNRVFVGLILLAFAVALLCDVGVLPALRPPGQPDDVAVHLKLLTDGAIQSAESAVSLAIGLIGVLALWMGLLRVAERAGLVAMLARLLRPVMTRLFPDVPPDHPAMGAMVMNMAANMLGLGNAATPLGLEAMRHLQELNPKKHLASNAMVLFLAINTSGLTLIPIRVIAMRAKYDSADPVAILLPTLLATLCSTVVAVLVAKLLAPRFSLDDDETGTPPAEATP